MGLSITIKDRPKTSQFSPAALAALFKGGEAGFHLIQQRSPIQFLMLDANF